MAEEEPKQMTLDAILDEKPPVEIPTERPDNNKQTWRDKEQGAKGLVRDSETGQYAPKEAKEAPVEALKEEVKVEVKAEVKPPVEEYSNREKAAFAKAADETRKRQALERQLAELKKEPPKPFYEDPDGALARQAKDQEEKLNQAILATTVRTSEMIGRSRHPDYDDKMTVFMGMVENAPYLADQAFQAQDPGEFAYQTAKTHKDLRDAGGIAEMRKKIEEDTRIKVRAEIEAELKTKKEVLERDRQALPGSLSDIQSKGVNRPTWGGPTSLENILKS